MARLRGGEFSHLSAPTNRFANQNSLYYLSRTPSDGVTLHVYSSSRPAGRTIAARMDTAATPGCSVPPWRTPNWMFNAPEGGGTLLRGALDFLVAALEGRDVCSLS
jgi:hypothetical protein